jgi:single-stranded-DNA-specific exonuclease
MVEGIFFDLDRLEPTGINNPSALFISRDLNVDRVFQMGKEGQHLKLIIKVDRATTYTAVAFKMGHLALEKPKRVDLLYSFERNFYNGQVTTQLMVRDIKIVA